MCLVIALLVRLPWALEVMVLLLQLLLLQLVVVVALVIGTSRTILQCCIFLLHN